MAYVITASSIGVKDGACVDVCPVPMTIHTTPDDDQYYIDSDLCLDSGACVVACPVDAVYSDSDVLEHLKSFIARNASKSKSP